MLQPDAVYVLKAHEPVNSVTFLNQQLQVGKKNGKIDIFCLSSLRSHNYELKAGTSPIIFISSDTERLVTQEKAGFIRVWDLESKSGYKMKHEINTEQLSFARAVSIDKNLLVAPSKSSNISVYDLTTGSEVQSLKPPTEDIRDIASFKFLPWTNGEPMLLSSYGSGHLILWDLKKSKAVTQLKYDFEITTIDYDLSSNRGIVAGPLKSKVCVFGIDKSTLELFRKDAENIEYTPNEGQKLGGISCIKIRPDKKCLIVGSCDGVVYIHSWKSLRKLATLKDHRGEISDIAFSDGQIQNFKSEIMAIGGVDGNITLWDIYYK